MTKGDRDWVYDDWDWGSRAPQRQSGSPWISQIWVLRYRPLPLGCPSASLCLDLSSFPLSLMKDCKKFGTIDIHHNSDSCTHGTIVFDRFLVIKINDGGRAVCQTCNVKCAVITKDGPICSTIHNSNAVTGPTNEIGVTDMSPWH